MIDIHDTERIGPKTALIYCRTPTIRQKAQGRDAAFHEALCRACAEGQGLAVARVFHGGAAADPLTRCPAVRDLLAHIARHSDQRFTVLVSGLDRDACDDAALATLTTQIKDAGADLEIIGQDRNPSPEDRFFAAIMMALGWRDISRDTETEGV